MKIAVVGGGFTGLSCALDLVVGEAEVVVYESEKTPGGLAGGVKKEGWRWSLEYFYHHIFTNDDEMINLSKAVGVRYLEKKPVTTSFIRNKEIALDSPLSVLRFSPLSVIGRLRMGAGLVLLKLIPNGLFLEKYRVVDLLPRLIGKEGYGVIWEKLLKAKFGPYAPTVNMAWYWTRVAKRTKNLGYFEGGFQNLANKCAEKIVKAGGRIEYGKQVKKIEQRGKKWLVDGEEFDGVVMTTPEVVARRILGEKSSEFPPIEYLWGQTLIVETKERFINGYWMNILEDDWPFLVAVEHTNMIDKKYYKGSRIFYLGNYLPEESKQLSLSAEELFKLYFPYLKKIAPRFQKKWVKSVVVYRKPFAQPVFPVGYSKVLPSIKSNFKGLYMANMSMVYPFDRGTNYAVKMGRTIAKMVLTDLR